MSHPHPDEVRRILSEELVDINHEMGLGNHETTFLCLAAKSHGRIEVLKLLINGGGADPNKADSHKMSPLHFAAMLGSIEVVKELLSLGANPDSTGTQFNRKKFGLSFGLKNGLRLICDMSK